MLLLLVRRHDNHFGPFSICYNMIFYPDSKILPIFLSSISRKPMQQMNGRLAKVRELLIINTKRCKKEFNVRKTLRIVTIIKYQFIQIIWTILFKKHLIVGLLDALLQKKKNLNIFLYLIVLNMILWKYTNIFKNKQIINKAG